MNAQVLKGVLEAVRDAGLPVPCGFTIMNSVERDFLITLRRFLICFQV